MHALRKPSSALRCLLRLLTTSVPAYQVRVSTSRRDGRGTRTRLDERGLEHVREEGEHWVERRKVLPGALGGEGAVLDTREQFGEDRQIEDERGREERILGETLA
jgi:hypothetical protein